MLGVGACVYALRVGPSRAGKACATKTSVKLSISHESLAPLLSQTPRLASVHLSLNLGETCAHSELPFSFR